jgi:hypothetical protein
MSNRNSLRNALVFFPILGTRRQRKRRKARRVAMFNKSIKMLDKNDEVFFATEDREGHQKDGRVLIACDTLSMPYWVVSEMSENFNYEPNNRTIEHFNNHLFTNLKNKTFFGQKN